MSPVMRRRRNDDPPNWHGWPVGAEIRAEPEDFEPTGAWCIVAGQRCPTPDLCADDEAQCAWPRALPRIAVGEDRSRSQAAVRFAVDRDIAPPKLVDAYLQGADDAKAVNAALEAIAPAEPPVLCEAREVLTRSRLAALEARLATLEARVRWLEAEE